MLSKLISIHVFFLLTYANSLAQESIVFKGYLEPSIKVLYNSHGHGELVFSVEEGEQIKKGDVLFKQNSTDYEDRKLNHESDIRKVAAGQTVQRLNYENRISQLKRRVEATLINKEIAEIVYKDLLAGADPVAVKIAEEKVLLSEQLLKSTELEYDLMLKLFKDGHITKEEIDELDFKIQKDTENLKLQKKELELIKQGPSQVEVEEAKIKFEIKSREHENTEALLKTLIKGYDELIKDLDDEMKRMEKRLAAIVEDLNECTVIANEEGTVFKEKFPWGDTIELGKHVWRGMPVRSIANLKEMKVVIPIPVESIDLYKVGMKCVIEVVGLNRSFDGKIEKILQIEEDEFARYHPKTKAVLGNANKSVFPVEIKLAGQDENLKPGLSARVIFNGISSDK